MTIVVWIASLVGAVLFAIVGFLVAKLTREEPPPQPLATGPSSAELAKLRMELDAARQATVSHEVALRVAEQAKQGAQTTAESLRRELETLEGERRSEGLRFRRREGELEATLESLAKERDGAQQQVEQLERALEAHEAEPTNLELSPAQFELLKDLLRKAEARERALAGELAELKAQLAQGFAAGAGRKPKTLVGMQAPPEDDDVLGTSEFDSPSTREFDSPSTREFDPPSTREFERPKTLIGVHDPTKLYRDAQVELDRTRAELEKARTEAGFWKKQAEKLSAEAALAEARKGAPAAGRSGRARASVGIKPTATTGRSLDESDERGKGDSGGG